MSERASEGEWGVDFFSFLHTPRGGEGEREVVRGKLQTNTVRFVCFVFVLGFFCFSPTDRLKKPEPVFIFDPPTASVSNRQSLRLVVVGGLKRRVGGGKKHNAINSLLPIKTELNKELIPLITPAWIRVSLRCLCCPTGSNILEQHRHVRVNTSISSDFCLDVKCVQRQ